MQFKKRETDKCMCGSSLASETASCSSLLANQKAAEMALFHSLLNRGAANNACYPPANCQQREIIILSPAH